ncbi:MAG: DUF4097 family beta strand repeat protein [Candidatus Eisenbacteria bacterium]|nr:DUF4097 family beta strand repeat protein [Candidatus Eisenbacteria bacterium]
MHSFRAWRFPAAGLAAACAVAVTLAPAVASDLDAARGTFDRTLSVASGVPLEVHTGSGDIRVHPGPAGRVHIVGKVRVQKHWWRAKGTAERRLREILSRPPIEQTSTGVVVGRDNDHDLFQNVSIDYVIEAPPGTRLKGRTGSGDILTRGLAASVDVSTGSGDIAVRDASGDARAETGSGDIVLYGVSGTLNAGTGSGDITAQGAPKADWKLGTGSGDVVLHVPRDAAFSLDVRTGSGDVQCTHPVTVTGRLGSHLARGAVNGGGPTVRVETGSGDVTVD